MYVIGFLGHDGSLGRTFYSHNMVQAVSTVLKMIEDDGQREPPEDYFEDECSFCTSLGYYFIGSLEDWENLHD